jgi:hypothetical protein
MSRQRDQRLIDAITRLDLINADGSEDVDAPELRWAESQSRQRNLRTTDGVPVLGHGDATQMDRQREQWTKKHWDSKEESRFQADMSQRGYDWQQDRPDADFWDSI